MMLNQGQAHLPTSTAYTLGMFIAEVMHQQGHNNVSLASVAGVSEGVIRNLLKYGADPKAKDPDPRTLRRVADALGVNALKLFRLAGYIPPAPNANSVRAELMADIFDKLPADKQEAVMRVVEAMADTLDLKEPIRAALEGPRDSLTAFNVYSPEELREIANDLIVRHEIRHAMEVDILDLNGQAAIYQWNNLTHPTQERVKALMRHKLSLAYDPTMVESEWRG